MDVNVGGTTSVLESCRRANVRRVVFASTSAIYENNTDFPSKETDEVHPTLIYPVSKLCAEEICKSYIANYDMDIVMTRYNNVYGGNQNFSRISPPLTIYIIKKLLDGESPILHSDGNQRRDYVYIDDVNKLNHICMRSKNAPGQIFNVASGMTVSVNYIFSTIAKALNSNIRPIFHTSSKYWNDYPILFEGRPLQNKVLESEVNKFTLGSINKALYELKWRAETSFEDGIKETIKNFKERHYD